MRTRVKPRPVCRTWRTRPRTAYNFNTRILLANLLQSSRSTLSRGSFLSFLAFKEGMLSTPISVLGGWPTVSMLGLGHKGQVHAERGFRFLKDPQFLASSLYLKKPERVMALLMVMTVCLLVYAALEHRICTALKEHGATFPDQKGQRIPNPTTRWVFHYFVGIHVLYIPGQGLMILNLTDEHQHLLQLLGKRYVWFYR